MIVASRSSTRLERNARREVCLDSRGENVDAGPLRREHEVDAGRRAPSARALQCSSTSCADTTSGPQLVDHTRCRECVRSGPRRPILRLAEVSSGSWSAHPPAARRALMNCRCCARRAPPSAVAAPPSEYDAVQRRDARFRVGYDVAIEMRDALVDRQLEDLRSISSSFSSSGDARHRIEQSSAFKNTLLPGP